MLVNFAYAFNDADPELRRWDHEWSGTIHREEAFAAPAELVLWPDGRVTFIQREELAPDRVITLRGERISRDAWTCPDWQC
jgi:hypothetical protein